MGSVSRGFINHLALHFFVSERHSELLEGKALALPLISVPTKLVGSGVGLPGSRKCSESLVGLGWFVTWVVFLLLIHSILPAPRFARQTGRGPLSVCPGPGWLQPRDRQRGAFGVQKDFPASFGSLLISFLKSLFWLCGIKDRAAWKQV